MLDVPDILKPKLNEFIRIGKRYQLQNAGIKEKVEEELITVLNKIFKVFEKTKSEHYSFYIQQDDYLSGPLYYRICFTMSIEDQTFMQYVNFDNILIRNHFLDAFALIIRNVGRRADSLSFDPEPLTEELLQLIEDLKKEIAFNLFVWAKYKAYYNKIKTLLDEKQRTLTSLISEIETIWNREVSPLPKNMPLQYYTDVNKTRNAVLERVNEDGDFEIRTPEGIFIKTSPSYCIWEDKFKKTELYEKMAALSTYEIPIEWRGNRLEFYS